VISSGVVSDFVLEIFSLKNLFLISFFCAREREREGKPRGRKKKKKLLSERKFSSSLSSLSRPILKNVSSSLSLCACVCVCVFMCALY
jgi:hypothetical protein